MLQKEVINSFEDFYKKGYNKDYPHIELVRLEKLFLDRNKKKTLEYGAGHGANGLHLLKNGYKVTFCDISKNAINLSKKKIDKKYKKNAKFIHLKNMDILENKIYHDYFDNIICLSVINNLSSIKEIKKNILLFRKILKKNGKLIIDTNLKENNYKILKRINSTTILTSIDKKNKYKFKMTFPRNISQFSKLLNNSGFKVLDIGHYSFKTFDQYSKEIIFSATKR